MICFRKSNNRVFVDPTVQGSARRKELFFSFSAQFYAQSTALRGRVEALASFRSCGQPLPSPLQCAKPTHSLPTFQKVSRYLTALHSDSNNYPRGQLSNSSTFAARAHLNQISFPAIKNNEIKTHLSDSTASDMAVRLW